MRTQDSVKGVALVLRRQVAVTSLSAYVGGDSVMAVALLAVTATASQGTRIWEDSKQLHQ